MREIPVDRLNHCWIWNAPPQVLLLHEDGPAGAPDVPDHLRPRWHRDRARNRVGAGPGEPHWVGSSPSIPAVDPWIATVIQG